MSGTVCLPAPRGEFVELSRTKSGRLYRKQILHVNDQFVHPANPTKTIEVTTDLARSLVDNFKAGYCDIVQVPIVNDANQHVEDPLRNLGEVVDVEYDDKGVYAVIDARKAEYAEELGKTLIGASAMLHMDYRDTRSGKKVGPTLLHVAVTNRPYITNLSGFEEIIAASADTSDEEPLLFAPAKEESMDLDVLLSALKDEHGIDVVALQEAVAASEAADDDTAPATDVQELVSALSGVLEAAGVVSLSATEEGQTITITDVAEAVVELAREKTELADTVAVLRADTDALRLANAESEVEDLVRQGRILPVQKEAMLELRMSNEDMFNRLVPETAIVSLSEDGVTVHDEPASANLDDEVARLTATAQDIQAGPGRNKK